eukprot:1341977-Amphidinium_carterae.1
MRGAGVTAKGDFLFSLGAGVTAVQPQATTASTVSNDCVQWNARNRQHNGTMENANQLWRLVPEVLLSFPIALFRCSSVLL